MPSNPSCAPPTALRSGGRRPISTGQPPQAPERLPQATEPIGQTCASRHDQHLVQGPFPEPVLRNCRLPTRYRLLLPVKAAKPWPLDFDLAAVEADLAFRFPPSGAPAGHDLAHAVDHRLLAHRDPSSRQGPPSQKPGKTTRSSPKSSTGPQASALSSESQ